MAEREGFEPPSPPTLARLWRQVGGLAIPATLPRLHTAPQVSRPKTGNIGYHLCAISRLNFVSDAVVWSAHRKHPSEVSLIISNGNQPTLCSAHTCAQEMRHEEVLEHHARCSTRLRHFLRDCSGSAGSSNPFAHQTSSCHYQQRDGRGRPHRPSNPLPSLQVASRSFAAPESVPAGAA